MSKSKKQIAAEIEELQDEELNVSEATKMLYDGLIVYPLTDFQGKVTGALGAEYVSDDQPANHFGLRFNPHYTITGRGVFGNVKTESDTLIITDRIENVLEAKRKGFDNVICCGFESDPISFYSNHYHRYTIMKEVYRKQIAFLKKKLILFYDPSASDLFGNTEDVCEEMLAYKIPVSVFCSDDGANLYDFLARGGTMEAILAGAKEYKG